YGGKKEIMAQIAPQGSVYQAGTLSGNPIAMAAGIATLEQLQKEGVYEALAEKSDRLAAGLADAARKAGVAARVNHVGSMLGMFFTDQEVSNFDDAKTCDLEQFAGFYQGMRQQGIYIAPSQFEVLFLSAAHSDEDIDTTIRAAQRALSELG
ncbi:MAG: aminotransferase class III-fold pyridoxal phosphate-dependent enzyme, partial [Deltaproteobacteria bacterium]|nr:aminotransferase class III-fold pyridoxal phosphate-dependent enzyme [Deltaproteobacteria bacterium]